MKNYTHSDVSHKHPPSSIFIKKLRQSKTEKKKKVGSIIVNPTLQYLPLQCNNLEIGAFCGIRAHNLDELGRRFMATSSYFFETDSKVYFIERILGCF